ncbi:LysE/ArgO family amino acid transporter [Corynebacterium tapiri]|uniref:Amino acid transporter n=1 Tax=Corynebacterium tapiri TaxID=1448266 RepID=A0A5C4U5M6_9CORY|nr:LysE family transporter [Corynebacterium tapiri]TNL99780.1 amino acid transporter [Corynebacterium tapiri]
MSIALAGFLLTLSIIFAVGPLNLLLIRQGTRREYVGLVIAVVSASMAFFYVVGMLFVGLLTESAPWLLVMLQVLGVAYLSAFAVSAFRDALKPLDKVKTVDQQDSKAYQEYARSMKNNEPQLGGTLGSVTGPNEASSMVASASRPSRRRLLKRPTLPANRPAWMAPVAKSLLVTWLNPGMYLDTFVIIGGVANQYGDPGRWFFITGGFLASASFFTAVGYGAKALSRPLSSPRVWRVLNIIIGIVLVGLAIKVAAM